jgi:hypothetical protein
VNGSFRTQQNKDSDDKIISKLTKKFYDLAGGSTNRTRPDVGQLLSVEPSPAYEAQTSTSIILIWSQFFGFFKKAPGFSLNIFLI